MPTTPPWARQATARWTTSRGSSQWTRSTHWGDVAGVSAITTHRRGEAEVDRNHLHGDEMNGADLGTWFRTRASIIHAPAGSGNGIGVGSAIADPFRL